MDLGRDAMDHDTSILARLKEEARLRHQNALDSRGANGAMSLRIRMSVSNCTPTNSATRHASSKRATEEDAAVCLTSEDGPEVSSDKAERPRVRECTIRRVIRGYAKDKNGKLTLIGTIPVPISKDKCSPVARREKRRLVRQGTPFSERGHSPVASAH
jgi:hypothetical protein